MALADRAQQFGQFQIAHQPRLLERWRAPAEVVVRHGGNALARHGARQQARFHGRIYDDANPIRLRVRQNRLFDFACQHRIGRLQRCNGRDGLRAAHFVRIEIGHTDPAHFAFALKLRHGGPAFLDVRVRLGPVYLVEVDNVQLETAQAGFRFGADGVRFQALANLAALVPNALAFGKHEWFAGAALQRAGYYLFGMAQAVDRGRVDPVDARIQRGVYGRYGLVGVLRAPGESPTAATHGPCAGADGRNVHIAVA